jgi:tetratricopeptide (TPR) repeat protein
MMQFEKKATYIFFVVVVAAVLAIGIIVVLVPRLSRRAVDYNAEIKKAIELSRQGKSTEALNILRRLPETDFNTLGVDKARFNTMKAQVLVAAGLENLAKHNYRLAIKYFEDAQALDASVSVVNDLALAYAQIGEKEKALALLNDAIQKEPTDPSHFEYRGAIYLSLGMSERAKADLKKVLLLNPNYPNKTRVLQLLNKLK